MMEKISVIMNYLYFFNLPNIIDVNPKYAPLKAKVQQIDIKLEKLDIMEKMIVQKE